MAIAGLAKFVESLPTTLRVAMVMQIYKEMFATHPFFKDFRNKRLFAFLGQRLRQSIKEPGEYLYRQGDEITHFIITTKGLAAFVHPRYHNQMFACIDVTMAKTTNNNKIIHSCGYEDVVINHVALIRHMEHRSAPKHNQEEQLTSRRMFNVLCIYNFECL